MTSKNAKRLDAINSKISCLLKAKSKLEEDFINDISKEIAKIFVKKNLYSLDKSALLKKIESLTG